LAGVEADYNLVAKINSKMAWEVFINTHKTGILVDLARQRLKSLEEQQSDGSATNPKVAALPPAQVPAKATAEEVTAWHKVKDSGDSAAIRRFLEKYPSSPLAVEAQDVLEELDRIAREREEKAVAEREAARQREEEARRAKEEADRQKAEREAALAKAARDEAERKRIERQREAEVEAERIRKAEADRKQAEHEIALAKAAREKADADRKKAERETELAKAAEAEAEAKRKAEADRQKAEQEAALAKAAREKAEAARQKAEREAALARAAEAEAERKRQAELAREKAEREAALVKAAQREAERKRLAESCSREEKVLTRLKAAMNQSAAREELGRFEQVLSCEDLRPAVVALVAEAEKLHASQTLLASQVRLAQQELQRIGCYSGRDDGMLGEATKDAIRRYHTMRGQSIADVNVTEALVSELTRASAGQCLDVAKTEKGKPIDKQAEKAKRSEKTKQAARPPRRESEEPRKLTTVRPTGSSPRVITGVGF
jgi:hypothetical protein